MVFFLSFWLACFWFCFYITHFLLLQEYLEASEPITEASLSPLSRNISLNFSRGKNWKYSDCHWTSPSKNILILHQCLFSLKLPLFSG